MSRAIADALSPGPTAARSCAILVPTRSAAGSLRNTLEDLLLAEQPAFVLPDIVTRDEWYTRMHERAFAGEELLSRFDREVLLTSAACDARAAGLEPPFQVRPALVAEMLDLYDSLRRQLRTVDAFERLAVEELEKAAGFDRGAERMLRQTRFLVRAFREYESRLEACRVLDEHSLRSRLLDCSNPPYKQVIVTVQDTAGDRHGLWPADFDLLARLPLLEQVDIVATKATLRAGFGQRLEDLMPGLDEQEAPDEDEARPSLLCPIDEGRLHFLSRDREDELYDIARRLKHRQRNEPSPLDRTAIVFRRPLPYAYLGRQVLEACGIPCQLNDQLPLAAEPFAAALDLVFELVSSSFERSSTTALLRSPFFFFTVDGRPIGASEVAALDRVLAAAGGRGGADALERLANTSCIDSRSTGDAVPASAIAAARAAGAACRALEPLATEAKPSEHIGVLLDFIARHERLPHTIDPLRERHLRARAAVFSTLEQLRSAHLRYLDRPGRFDELASAIRRWIEEQTFAPRSGSAGLQLLDADAAPYGNFDEIHIVGPVEGEWPESPSRNIFYPPFMLNQLGWPAERDRLSATRAAFGDLLRLARQRVAVSVFSLEDDSIVDPSCLLGDLEREGLDTIPIEERPSLTISWDEAVSGDGDLPAIPAGPPAWAAPASKPCEVGMSTASSPGAERAELCCESLWHLRVEALRRDPTVVDDPRFRGSAGSPGTTLFGVRAVEQYLDCPFKYFAAQVLRLQEDPLDEETMGPLARGRFVHEILRDFFERWRQAGEPSIVPETLGRARALFAEVVESAAAKLPSAEATLERLRLLGSPGVAGLADVVLGIEAIRSRRVVERLMEHRLEGELTLESVEGPRRVAVRGVADRIDLLEDGSIEVFDYKTGRAPEVRRAVQLPVYAVCATQQLEGHLGRSWHPGGGGYISMASRGGLVPLVPKGGDLNAALAAGQERFMRAVDGIRAGNFPPRPAERRLCTRCAFSGVCRKDYSDD
jgi:RecB family exonuclease